MTNTDDTEDQDQQQRERDKPLSDRRTPPATMGLLESIWWFARQRTRHRNAVEARAREQIDLHAIDEDRVREIVREELDRREGDTGTGGDTGNGDSGAGDGTDDGDGDQDQEGDAEPDWFPHVGRFGSPPPDPPTRSDADRVVAGRDAFVDAVRSADVDATIWIPGDATIDMSGWADLDPPAGLTIASNRAPSEGRPGGRIHVRDTDHKYLFKTRANRLRLTGLRLEGPHTEWMKQYRPDKIRAFGHFMGEACRFDNNEVYGWPFCGFALGARNVAPGHEIDYNHFHDNLMEGLGYGVELYNGFHQIHHNYFDRCRHAIAGFGYRENGFRARFNVVGPEPLSHAFDMHALEESVSGGGDVAGSTIRVVSNLFEFTSDLAGRGQEAVAIRGIPENECYIAGNHFSHPGPPDAPGSHGDAFRQQRVDDWTNLRHEQNEFETDLSFDPPS